MVANSFEDEGSIPEETINATTKIRARARQISNKKNPQLQPLTKLTSNILRDKSMLYSVE